MSTKDRKIIITDDGNQRMTAVERLDTTLSDNPADFPSLKASHLMGTELTRPEDTHVRTEVQGILSERQRAVATGLFLFKFFRDRSLNLLYDTWLLGREGFVTLLSKTDRPDSLASGLDRKHMEVAWEEFDAQVRELGRAGARWRKRKDWRG